MDVDVSPIARSPDLDHSSPRKRQRTACDRCKRRKQRCDNGHPRCSNCTRSGADCSRPVQQRVRRTSYTYALERRVEALTEQLKEGRTQQTFERAARDQELRSSYSSPVDDQERPRSSEQNLGLETPSSQTSQNQQTVADVVGMLSLGSGNTDSSSYIGSSSGYALATDLGRMVQATAWNKALWVPTITSQDEEAHFYSGSSTRRITVQELQSSPAEPPSDVLGAKLIQAYLGRIHPRFPFLFRSDVWKVHENRHILGKQPRGEPNHAIRAYSSVAYDSDGFALFVLYMVYAIGALNLRLTEGYRDTSPEQLYVYAMQHVASVREASPIHNLEATVLMILYHLRSESRNGLWHLTGLAMRTVTDIGLHRAASTHGIPAFEAQMRRRLFWSIFSLESILAGTLGRPISLSESDIDQPLPASIDESDLLANVPPETVLSTHVPERQALPPTTLSQFILLAQLHVFEARIQRKVYRVDKSTVSLLPKMNRLMSDLESWRCNVLPTLRVAEHDRVLLHFYRNVRLLMQPFLSILDPNSEPFRKAAVAAGQICQIHKRFHQTPEYGHSFVAVHTAFVSGITLLYVLWRGKERLWSISISNDIRAASCVLSIMGERAPWIRRFRDTFDILVEATMAALEETARGARDPMGNDNHSTNSRADFSLFEHLDLTDHGALDMARELTEWIR